MARNPLIIRGCEPLCTMEKLNVAWFELAPLASEAHRIDFAEEESMPRPAGVTVLAVLNWIFACGFLLLAAGFFLGFQLLGAMGVLGMPTPLFTAIGTFGGILFLL